MDKQREFFRLNLIRIIRKKGLTQKAFAKWAQLKESEISRIVNQHIPLTIERVSHICMQTGLEVNEFYREDIIVDCEWRHETVRLLTDEPVVKAKRKRMNRSEKKIYRLTRQEFLAFKESVYNQGYADGLRAGHEYSQNREPLYQVAEE